MELKIDRLASPIGTILLVFDDAGLRALDFGDHEPRLQHFLKRHYGPCTLKTSSSPRDISRRIEAYFEGEPNALDGIPLETGGTPFQRKVWAALRKIRFGETTSYGELAARIGKPSACRAVGLANGANPIAIVVPCHRVIGSDGTLTGYGGGLERKRWLLQHEGAAFVAPKPAAAA
ncbi:MAG: methylated-DNA--[protein]-cysteine S-methyltransferase [Proteobacteria bacterium]|nr:methylated-DNA--[protein]-cysteine S-methyltransferase [Pseudomonadota bacterium]MBI3496660.1 methylated-DNA--[protein]-cysteine S-methyltransferase [Pseudomonadota bacterium]